MTKNIALFGRREIQAHRRLVSGMTASVPVYKVVDGAGNKEWVVDVYIGPPQDSTQLNIIYDVPIASIAKELIGGLRIPVSLERSRQGKYTVVGRSKTIPSGAQMPDGSILEPTYHEITYNLADLGLTFIADVDYSVEVLQSDPSQPFQADPDEPLQVVAATDAFGLAVLGPDAEEEFPLISQDPSVVTTARHVKIQMAKLGPSGDPEAMKWGESVLQPPAARIVQHVS